VEDYSEDRITGEEVDSSEAHKTKVEETAVVVCLEVESIPTLGNQTLRYFSLQAKLLVQTIKVHLCPINSSHNNKIR
jgi:hypothetical protein